MRNSMGLHSAEDQLWCLFGIGSRGKSSRFLDRRKAQIHSAQVHECWHSLWGELAREVWPCMRLRNCQHLGHVAANEKVSLRNAGRTIFSEIFMLHCKHGSKRGLAHAHHNAKTSPWQFDKTIPRGGRMAHSTSPTVNRRSIPPLTVSRGRPPLRGT